MFDRRTSMHEKGRITRTTPQWIHWQNVDGIKLEGQNGT